MLKKLLELFIKTNGRKPNKLEWLQLKFKASQQSGKGEVVPFPKDNITEVLKKESPLKKDDFFRIKQGLSTKMKLNSLRENEQFAKDLINRKNTEFNSLNRASQKEILDRLDIQIKNAKADMATSVNPDDTPFPFADGGVAGLLGERTGFHGGGGATAPQQEGFSSFEEMMKLKTPNLGQPNFYYDLEGARRNPEGGLFTPKPGELPQTLSRPMSEERMAEMHRSQIGNGIYDLNRNLMNNPDYFKPLPSSP